MDQCCKCEARSAMKVGGQKLAASTVVGLAAAAFFVLLELARWQDGGSRQAEHSVRYHGDHMERHPRKYWVTKKEQLATMALQQAGDPDGFSVRQAADQAASFVALFFEACPVDGPTYCGTYRLQRPVAEGMYPVYANQHGRVLYRNTKRHMWVIIDGDKYTPELSAEVDLPGPHRANSLLPTTRVPMGSNEWSWGSSPPASYHEMVKKGVIAETKTQMLRNERTLTVTGLFDEEEVLRFESYAEEQLELEVEAGHVDASSVAAGGTEGEARPAMSVYLEMPFDIGSSTRLKLVMRSGAIAEFGISGDLLPGKNAQALVGELIGIGDPMLSDIDMPPAPVDIRLSRWDTASAASSQVAIDHGASRFDSSKVDGPILRCDENQLKCYGWQTKGRKKIAKWVQLWSNREHVVPAQGWAAAGP